MHTVSKEERTSLFESWFADVSRLQQLRVLQHNRQDHRIDAGPSSRLSFFSFVIYCLVSGDMQPADRHGSQVSRPQLNFPD